MAAFKKYRLNPETLLYEIEKVSARSRFNRIAWLTLSTLVMTAFYLWLFTSVLGVELPKTTLLRRKNAEWVEKMQMINHELDRYDAALEGLGMRDEEIYRNIFGLDGISSAVRNSGFGGVNRYDALADIPETSLLKRTAVRLDNMTKKTYIQSKSFDEIAQVAQRADDMVSCIPAVMPVNPDPSTYRKSSTFGYRTDPFTGASKMHTGYDFSCPPGNPVYTTGDGVVKEVKFELFGYGNSILIDHGFGYMTRYAHLRTIYVAEGMKLKRGECIGESGNTGRSSGPHLHYEVMLRGNYVNPTNYFDFDMPKDEYMTMVKKAESESTNMIVRPNQRVRIR